MTRRGRGTPRAWVAVAGLSMYAVACGGAPVHTARRAPGDKAGASSGYEPDRAPRRIAALEERAREGDESAARHLALTRADLLVYAQLTKDASLARTLASSWSTQAERACRPPARDPEALAAGCMPALWRASARELTRAGGLASRAGLFEAVARGWNDPSGAFFSSIRTALRERNGEHAAVAAAAIAWAVAFDVLSASAQVHPDRAIPVLASGLAFECPTTLAKLSGASPDEWGRVLQEGGCSPRCAEDGTCTAKDLGVRTELGVAVTRGNIPAWIAVRTVRWLVVARDVLAEAKGPLAMTIREQQGLRRIDDRLEALRVPVPPPAQLDAGRAGRVTLPRWRGPNAPWVPSATYVVVGADQSWLGAAPTVVATDRGARIVATPFPGIAVPPARDEASLELDTGASGLVEVLDRLRRETPRSFDAAPSGSMLLLADADRAARRVARTGARVDEALGVNVHLAVVSNGGVGVLRLPPAPARRRTKGARVLLHLGAQEHRLTGPGGPIATDGKDLVADLAQARRMVSDGRTLDVAMDAKVDAQRLVDVLRRVATAPERARFERVRLVAGPGRPRVR